MISHSKQLIVPVNLFFWGRRTIYFNWLENALKIRLKTNLHDSASGRILQGRIKPVNKLHQNMTPNCPKIGPLN